MKNLFITVQDMAGLNALRPLTGGVPIAEGVAPEGSVFVLHDHQGNTIPLQTSVLARWHDGSVRWLLLDFQSRPPANGKVSYVLSWGENAPPKAPDVSSGLKAIPGTEKQLTLESGNVKVSLAEGALLNISGRLEVILTLTDAEGQVCNAVVEAAEVETTGKLRSTLSLLGSFRSSRENNPPAPSPLSKGARGLYGKGKRIFQFRLRASIYAGLSMIRLEPLILVDADKGVIQHIREMKLTFRPRNHAQSVHLGGDSGWEGPATSAARIFQYDDQHYVLPKAFGVGEASEQNAAGEGSKAPGWAELDDGQGAIAVALRDFWQQWPKSLEASYDGVSIGLFPRFDEGDYAHIEPWYKYQYLFAGNCYRLRTGQARRWDIWLDLNGDGEKLAMAANAPLVPAADPAQAIAAGVWDAIAPAGIPEMVEYDVWAENLFNTSAQSPKLSFILLYFRPDDGQFGFWLHGNKLKRQRVRLAIMGSAKRSKKRMKYEVMFFLIIV